MKNRCFVTLIAGIALFAGAQQAQALHPETEALLELLQMKGVITAGDASDLRQSMEQTGTPQETEISGEESAWEDTVHLSGLIEVEMAAARTNFDAPGIDTTTESDITLATVELGVDAQVAEHVSTHVLLLYSDDVLDVDEAIITIVGGDNCPIYLNAGKMYVPFGNFATSFIADPLTLELGETGEAAVTIGAVTDTVDFSLTAFRGSVGMHEDADINNYVASLHYTMPERENSAFGLTAGISYTSHLAESGSLEEVGAGITGVGPLADDVTDKVAGIAAFISLSFADQFTIDAEYVGAVDDFAAGDLAFDNNTAYSPSAWNIEFAYAHTDQITYAFRYGGASDAGSIGSEFLAEQQYGAIFSYQFLDNTNFGLQLLQATNYEGDETLSFTGQLAVEF